MIAALLLAGVFGGVAGATSAALLGWSWLGVIAAYSLGGAVAMFAAGAILMICADRRERQAEARGTVSWPAKPMHRRVRHFVVLNSQTADGADFMAKDANVLKRR